MWLVGLFYILLSTTPHWLKAFQLNFNKDAKRMYLMMLITGITTLALGIVNTYLEYPQQNAISVVPVAAFGTYTVHFVLKTLESRRGEMYKVEKRKFSMLIWIALLFGFAMGLLFGIGLAYNF